MKWVFCGFDPGTASIALLEVKRLYPFDHLVTPPPKKEVFNRRWLLFTFILRYLSLRMAYTMKQVLRSDRHSANLCYNWRTDYKLIWSGRFWLNVLHLPVEGETHGSGIGDVALIATDPAPRPRGELQPFPVTRHGTNNWKQVLW